MDCLDNDSVLAFLEGDVDDRLRALILSHLADCSPCADLVAISAGGATEMSARHSLGDALSLGASLRPGSTAGRYVILNLVGRGGMGEVYAAYDPRLERKVALKLLRESTRRETQSPSAQERLLREAQSTARLSHPNVVVVYDAGAIDDEVNGVRVYLAMEFVEGPTLSEWLAAAPRSWRAIRDAFIAAGEGLAAAHEAGLVHRDFKPQNVMVTADGSVRVMDFGLASDRSKGSAGELSDLVVPGIRPTVQAAVPSGTGCLLGTPLYMAPEQFLARPSDARTDQFGFCVALYEAIYGEHPFQSDSLETLTAAVVSGRIREPVERKSVPTFLRRVVLRGLRTDPAARYPSMRALLAALRADPAERRRKVMIGVAAAMIAVVAFVGTQRVGARGQRICHGAGEKLVGIWERNADGPHRTAVHRSFLGTGSTLAEGTWVRVASLLDDYADGWTKAYADACEATHVRGDQSAEVLDLRMTCLDDARGAVKALTSALTIADSRTLTQAVDAVYALPPLGRCADVAALRAVVPPPTAPAVRARVAAIKTQLSQVKALTDTGQWSEARVRMGPLVKDARATEYKPLLAEALAASAWLNADVADVGAVRRTLEESVWVGLAAHRDDIAAESAAEMIPTIAVAAGSTRQVERWDALAESLIKRLGPGNDRIVAWFYQNRAGLLYERGDFQGAATNLERALDLKRKALPATDPDIAITLGSLAYIRGVQGEGSTALVLAHEARAIDQRAYGSKNPHFDRESFTQGVVLRTLGRYREAEDHLRLALNLGGDDHAYDFDADLLAQLGMTLLAQRKYQDADAYLARARRLYDLMPLYALDRASTMFAFAEAEWALNRNRPAAVRMAIAAREIYRPMPDCRKRVDEIDAWLSGRVRDSAHVQTR